MERYLLRYFLAVVETGNFSRAADRESVAQPTLSAGIAKLEAGLGARLFDRTNRRVHLTEAGNRFLVHARRIEHEFNLAEAAVSGARQARSLRAAVISTLPTALIERLITAIGDERLELLEGAERDVLNLLDRRRVDVALTVQRPAVERFEPERLFEEGYGLALPAGHRLAGAATLKGEDLADEVMMVRRHCEALADTSRYFLERNVRPAFSHRGSNDDRMLGLVRAGLGLTVMPDCFTEVGVVRAALEGFRVKRTIALCYADPSARYRTTGFVQAARDVFGR